MWPPSGENASPSRPCSEPLDTWPLRSSTGAGATCPPRIARIWPDLLAMYRAPSLGRHARASAPAMLATGVSRTWMAARLGPPVPAAPPPPAPPPPPPPPVVPRGAVAAGRRPAVAGGWDALGASGVTVPATVVVVVSGPVGSDEAGTAPWPVRGCGCHCHPRTRPRQVRERRVLRPADGAPSEGTYDEPMKYAVCVPDGAADEPIAELGARTPLEDANMPNLASLARSSEVGRAATIPAGMPPGSDVGNM